MSVDDQIKLILEIANTAGNTGIFIYSMYLLEGVLRCLIFFGGIYAIAKMIVGTIKWHALHEAEKINVKYESYIDISQQLAHLRVDLVKELNKELKEIKDNKQ